jgi:hypothetical protein
MVQLSWTGIGAATAALTLVAALLWWFVPKSADCVADRREASDRASMTEARSCRSFGDENAI